MTTTLRPVLEKERIYFLDKPLVKWRQRDGSLSHTSKSPATINDIEFFYKVRRFLLLKNKCILQFVDSSIYYYILKNVVIEEKSKFFKLLWLLSPLFYIRCIKKIITSEWKVWLLSFFLSVLYFVCCSILRSLFWAGSIVQYFCFH